MEKRSAMQLLGFLGMAFTLDLLKERLSGVMTRIGVAYWRPLPGNASVLMGAYKALEADALTKKKVQLTTEGHLIADLGLGLGDAPSEKCHNCSGNGYTLEDAPGYSKCKTCKGDAWVEREVEEPCRACNGTGFYKGKGKCWTCGGSGIYKLRRREPCPTCNSQGISKKRALETWKDEDAEFVFEMAYPHYGQVNGKVKQVSVFCRHCGGKGHIRVSKDPAPPVPEVRKRATVKK